MAKDLNTNQVLATAIVQQLIRDGVHHFVVSPGGRSAPLVDALSREKNITCHRVFDERSAGFYGLGIAKATHTPVALICTSGSAVANYLPSIVEASQAHVPMIVLSADRPAYLRPFGAAQTIDQTHIFGTFVRWFHDCGMPEDVSGVAAYGRAIGRRAFGEAVAPNAGPVHINCPFPEPLLGPGLHEESPAAGPVDRVPLHKPAPTLKELEIVSEQLQNANLPWIVVGPSLPSAIQAARIFDLAGQLQIPVFMDATSNLAFGPWGKTNSCRYFDTWLRDGEVASYFQPDLVLRVGGLSSSKVLEQHLAASGATQIAIGEPAISLDPHHACEFTLQGDLDMILQAVSIPEKMHVDARKVTRLVALDHAIGEHVDRVTEAGELSEVCVPKALLKRLPESANLVVASSMPIRDLDWYAGTSYLETHVYANRGANGIDGLVSTAAGVAIATQRPTALLCGDVAFFHDIGGLTAANLNDVELTIVVVNNDGGGIFAHLPFADRTQFCEEWFVQPHGYGFADIAKGFGFDYVRLDSRAALDDWAWSSSRRQIVEIVVDREQDLALYERLWNTKQVISQLDIFSEE